jgi:hypothetical protein
MLDQDRSVMNQVATVTEMQAIVRFAAEPTRAGELVKAQINRAARILGLTPRRAETFWYGRPGRVLAEEADAMRAWREHAKRTRRDRLLAEIAELDRRELQLRLDIGGEKEQLRLSMKIGDTSVDL